MKILFHSKLKKQLKKYPFLTAKAGERILLFLRDPHHPLLNNHALIGRYVGYRSINITGDYRAVYRLVEEDVAFFVDLDTHSNLYR